MRGRPRKPPKVHQLAGNPGKRPLPSAPAPSSVLPEPFGWMTELAQAEWCRVAPDLASRGLLHSLDLMSLATYCERVATYQRAIATIEKEGEYIDGKRHPASVVRDNADKSIAAWSRELGLVPTARQRLGVTEPTEEEDEMDQFLKGER